MNGDGQPWPLFRIVASQTAVLTALLFYFGWVRANATFRYFGVDISLLGFSTSDYLLRSVNSAFRPLLVAGLVAAAATGVHQWLIAVAGRGDRLPRWARQVPVAALGVSVVLAAIGLSAIAIPELGRELGVWLLPLCLAASFALLAYAELIWPRFRSRAAHTTPQAGRQLRSFLLVGLALLALFWTVSLYAAERGRQVARRLTRDLPSRAEVVIYAKDRLALAGPGVEVAAVRLPDTKYQHRYSGLRLLVRSHERYVLLPVGWTRGRGSAYVIRDGDDVRLEFMSR